MVRLPGWARPSGVTVRPRTPCRPETESAMVWAWRSDGKASLAGRLQPSGALWVTVRRGTWGQTGRGRQRCGSGSSSLVTLRTRRSPPIADGRRDLLADGRRFLGLGIVPDAVLYLRQFVRLIHRPTLWLAARYCSRRGDRFEGRASCSTRGPRSWPKCSGLDVETVFALLARLP